MTGMTLTASLSHRLKVTSKEQEKMRQSIEKHRKTKLSEAAVTAMFHDRRRVLAGCGLSRARDNGAQSLSESLTMSSNVFSYVKSLSALLKLPTKYDPSRNRTRCRSLSNTEKFPAEGPMARFALAVLAAYVNSRSLQAVATLITPMTEQRRCFAA